MAYNSTIISKKKRCKTCGKMDYIFSKGECKTCSTISSTKKRIAKHEEIEEDESLQDLILDLDVWFSKYIRLKYANEKGRVRCFTSGVEMRWQEAQCGHYISRKHLNTRWTPQNARPQSEYENCNLHGNLEVFAANLEKESAGTVAWLEEQGRDVFKPTRDELKQLLIIYRNKVKLLEKKIKK